jgi:hypothetical protein
MKKALDGEVGSPRHSCLYFDLHIRRGFPPFYPKGENPRLCRGGSSSLTFTGVCHGFLFFNDGRGMNERKRRKAA